MAITPVGDGAAIHDNVASEISGITEKATPVDADLLVIEDSEASDVKKSVQLGNLPRHKMNVVAVQRA